MDRNLLVRPATPEDFAQWLPLGHGYNAFYGRAGATALPEQVTQTTWQRFFDAYEPVHARVAEQGGALLGLAHFLFHRSTIRVGPNGYLNDLFTDEAARGRGVGRPLIEAVAERARDSGATSVYWLTHETNATTMRLYDQVAAKSGFIDYRRESP